MAEFATERFVKENPPRRRAALAGGADGPEHNPARGQLQVGARGDNDCIVAAQFEQCAAQAARNNLADVPPHPSRAGGRDERDSGVGSQAFADCFVITDHQTENCGIDIIVPANPFGDFDHRNRRERGLGRWFPNGGIAAHRRQDAVPGPNRHREIEGRDDAHHSERMPLL